MGCHCILAFDFKTDVCVLIVQCANFLKQPKVWKHQWIKWISLITFDFTQPAGINFCFMF